jgi:hypothetical protein
MAAFAGVEIADITEKPCEVPIPIRANLRESEFW